MEAVLVKIEKSFHIYNILYNIIKLEWKEFLSKLMKEGELRGEKIL